MFEAELDAAALARLRAGDAAVLPAVAAVLDATPGARAQLVEALGELLDAPTLRLRLELRRHGRQQLAEGWIGPGLVLLAVGSADDGGAGHAVAGTDTELPRIVAELVDLGPRTLRAGGEEIVLPFQPLDAFGGAGLARADLEEIHVRFDGIHDPLELDAVFGGTALQWSLTMWSAGRADDPEVAIVALDGREHGQWTLWPGPEPDSVAVRPTTTSAIWIMLAGALDAASAELSAPPR